MNGVDGSAERDLITRQECSPDNSLPVNPRSVRASEVSHVHETICLHKNAVKFGNGAVIDGEVGLSGTAAHDRDRFRERDGRSIVLRYQLRQHVLK